MQFLDDSLLPENQQPLVIQVAPYGPEFLPGDSDDIPVTMAEQAIRSFSGMVQAVSRSSPVLIAAKARRGRSIVSLFCDRAGLPQPRRHHGKLNTSTNPHADRVSSAITIHRPCRGDLPCGAGTPRRPKAVAKLAKI